MNRSAAPRRDGALQDPARLMRRARWLLGFGAAAHLAYGWTRADAAGIDGGALTAPGWMGVALVLVLAAPVCNTLRVWRWSRFMRPGYSLLNAARVVASSDLGAALTPSVVGGAPVKIATLAGHGLGVSRAAALALLGSVEDTLALAIVLPALVWAGDLGKVVGSAVTGLGATFRQPVWAGGALLGVGAAALGLMWAGRRGGWRVVVVSRVRELGAAFALVGRRGGRVLMVNVALAAVQWSARLLIVVPVAASLGVTLPMARAMVLQWLCLAGMAAVPTPGATGGAEAAFMVVFARDVPGDLLPLVMGGWRLMSYYAAAGVALLMLLGPRRPGSPDSAHQQGTEDQQQAGPQRRAGDALGGGVPAQVES